MSAVQLIRASNVKRTPVTCGLRGHSAIVIRDASETSELQEFSGVASRTELDRVGDVVDAAGVAFSNPVPVLWQHRHDQPIGRAWLSRAGDEIHFNAKLPKIDEPGPLRDRVREAWLAVKSGIVDSVSIGFRTLENPEPLQSGGWRYPRVEIIELSLVSVPALPSARVDAATVKAMDGGNFPASRDLPPGLTNQQRLDLLHAEARRELGKLAKKSATYEALYVAGTRLAANDRALAKAVADLDGRLRAIEDGQRSLRREATRDLSGAVRLVKAR